MSPERLSIIEWNAVNAAAGENECHIVSLSPFIFSHVFAPTIVFIEGLKLKTDIPYLFSTAAGAGES